MDFDLKAYWEAKRQQVDAALDLALAPEAPPLLYEAMRYSTFAGGKRLRPVLCLAACEAVGGQAEAALGAAAALELVHTQSLIHDDLPAMDDDDLRRGRPTNHKVYGEANAILAGDAMLAVAFQVMLQGPIAGPAPAEAKAQAAAELAQAVVRMVGGQVVDLASEGVAVGPETLAFIHAHKTGALIQAAVVMGGRLGGANAEQLAALSAYGEALGLAFQIADDILDETADAATLGKTPGKDREAEKATYVRIHGMEGAHRELEASTQRALSSVAGWPQAEALRAMARFVGQQVAKPLAS